MRVSRLFFVLTLLSPGRARRSPCSTSSCFCPARSRDRHFRPARRPTPRSTTRSLQADALLSLQKGPFKLFGEYLLSDHEGDLERFQLGWQLSGDTVIWIGRFHQPTSVWNHDHHHGQYLQTSITRPAIDEWEDLRRRPCRNISRES